MHIPRKYLLFAIGVFIILISILAYLVENPRTISVPDYRQTQIDSTTWVRRSRYERRGKIIQKLTAENKQMGRRVRRRGNTIAAYVQIVGHLHSKIDSLAKDQQPEIRHIKGCHRDTTLTWSRTFGNKLFRETSTVSLHGDTIQNVLSLQQLRPVKITVVNTIAKNNSAVLTYVNSPDFDSLHYRSVTNLKSHKKLPRFWLGSAATLGVVAILKFLIN